MEALNKIAVIGNLIGETEKMALTLKLKKKKKSWKKSDR